MMVMQLRSSVVGDADQRNSVQRTRRSSSYLRRRLQQTQSSGPRYLSTAFQKASATCVLYLLYSLLRQMAAHTHHIHGIEQ